MSELIGYKGISSSGTEATVSEQEEREILQEIFDNVDSDILGEKLYARRRELLAKMGTDTGYFYAPYIPLQYITININVNS